MKSTRPSNTFLFLFSLLLFLSPFHLSAQSLREGYFESERNYRARPVWCDSASLRAGIFRKKRWVGLSRILKRARKQMRRSELSSAKKRYRRLKRKIRKLNLHCEELSRLSVKQTRTFRINSGGPAYTDTEGNVWSADTDFLGGDTYSVSNPISDTDDDTLYQSERYATLFGYAINVPNGKYLVSLHFAEIFWERAGERVFDISLEDLKRDEGLDIFQEVGSYSALVKRYQVTVGDGVLDLLLTTQVNNAKLSAIEIEPYDEDKDPSLGTPTPTPTPCQPGNPGCPDCSELQVSRLVVDYGEIALGGTSSAEVFVISNLGPDPVTIASQSLVGINPQDFAVSTPLPSVLLPGESGTVAVQFSPDLGATRRADLRLDTDACSAVREATPASEPVSAELFDTATGVLQLALVGDGEPIPPVGDIVRINAGGSAYVDTNGDLWDADRLFVGGDTFQTNSEIDGTDDDPLYQSERYGGIFAYEIPVANATYEVNLYFAEIFWESPGERIFDVIIEDELRRDDLDIYSQVGSFLPYVESFEVDVSDNILNIAFDTLANNAKISAIEVVPSSGGHDSGHPFLHVVIDSEGFAVDYDGDGSEIVPLDGSPSHTHEPGKGLAAFSWWTALNGELPRTLGDAQEITATFPVGEHRAVHTIFDNNDPAEDLSSSITVKVYPLDAVGGLLVDYYDARETNLGEVLRNLSATVPQYREIRQSFEIPQLFGKVGNSPFTNDVVVRSQGRLLVEAAGQYEFIPVGGVETLLFIDGDEVTGPVSLSAGEHEIDFRFYVEDNLDVLPANLLWRPVGSGDPSEIDEELLSHDESLLPPYINEMPLSGLPQGGGEISIRGIGFFPSDQVEVLWGDTVLSGNALTVSPFKISFELPAGNGTVSVRVQTPNGQSNTKQFVYDDEGPVPIQFTSQTVATNLVDTTNFPFTGPTQGTWGPDGRLYLVSNADGLIVALTFDDNYNVINRQNITTLSGLSNNSILGIAFNPADDATNARLYVSHTAIYARGGGCFNGSFDYIGEISVLTGPNFENRTSLISNLPTSNHDHGVNGLQFDNSGNLLIAVGGNTNAGVTDCGLGGVPESPLSAAIVKAPVWKDGFNGVAEYVETFTGDSNNDQVFGEIVDLAEGVDLEVFIGGLRNTFDIAYGTNGFLYGSDNGPNPGNGDASTGANSSIPLNFFTEDEINLLREGHYYGHPNRNRGRYDAREYLYWNYDEPSVFNDFTGALASLPSSTNGITEYRATTFNSGIRGSLFAQEWNTATHLVELSPDGRSVEATQALNLQVSGLDVTTGPGGAVILVDYSENSVHVLQPNDISAPTTGAYDIFPWRGNAAGGQTFVIGGVGFGALGDTTIRFGDIEATLTSVSATRIRGVIPANSSDTGEFVDIEVVTNGVTSTIERAFRYLVEPQTGKGSWRNGTPIPSQVGETGGAVLNGVLYVFGTEPGLTNEKTLAYDLVTGEWDDSLAKRPIPGDHHAVVAHGGKIYLFGGLPNHLLQFPQEFVQIYNPATDSWSFGASIPGGGSGSGAAVSIGDFIYYGGGIQGPFTTDKVYRYDPDEDSWTAVASMPVGRNHIGSATDGKKWYLFGGRDAGEEVSAGFNDVQIYDPETNNWEWSKSSALIPDLPQARGGLSAAYLDGEFYIIGGETVDGGAGATLDGVYDRVDVYNPGTRTWRLDAALPTARHGLTVLSTDGKVYALGGGIENGYSQSTIVEVLER